MSILVSVNVPDDGKLPNFSDRSGGDKLDSITFYRHVIAKAIKKLKPNLSAGPDGYPPVLICKLVNSVAEPLAMIFQFIYVSRASTQCMEACHCDTSL